MIVRHSLADLKSGLQAGLAGLQLIPEDTLCDALLTYSALLQEWNRRYNLTTITDPERIIHEHFLDSLSIYPFLLGEICLDVGTGAGLPGLPLALVEPKRRWVLIDSNIKKIRFVREVSIRLGIHNIDIIHARVEQYRPAEGFNTIVSRAFAPALDFYHDSQHLIAEEGRWLAMKGPHYQSEIMALETEHIAYKVDPIVVPGLEKTRFLISMHR